jgi:hypothetical protein
MDDTVIFSESLECMQKALDIFQEYCNLWKLSVNSSKTKVIPDLFLWLHNFLYSPLKVVPVISFLLDIFREKIC